MEKIKVVLGIVPENISLSLRTVFQQEKDIEIIKEVVDPIKLLITIGETEADVAIISGQDFDEDPGICSHLLAEYPRLLVFALLPEARRGYLFRQSITREPLLNLSGRDIVAAIRRA